MATTDFVHHSRQIVQVIEGGSAGQKWHRQFVNLTFTSSITQRLFHNAQSSAPSPHPSNTHLRISTSHALSLFTPSSVYRTFSRPTAPPPTSLPIFSNPFQASQHRPSHTSSSCTYSRNSNLKDISSCQLTLSFHIVSFDNVCFTYYRYSHRPTTQAPS